MYIFFDVVNFDVLEFKGKKKFIYISFVFFLFLINIFFFLVIVGFFVALIFMNKVFEKVIKLILVDVSFNN